MNDKPQKAENFWGSLKRLLSLLGTEKLVIFIVFLAAILGIVFTIATPTVLGWATDVIVHSAFNNASLDWTALNKYLAILVSCYLLGSLLNWFSSWLLNRSVMRVIFQLRQDIEAKLHRLPLSYFDSNKRGDIISRTTNDVDNIQTALQQGFSTVVSSGVKIIAVLGIMLWLSWQLALISLLSIPLMGILVGVIGVRAQKLFTKQWAATGEVNAHVEESFSGHELVRVFNRDEEMLAKFTERNTELRDTAIKAQALSGIFFPATQFVNYLVFVLTAIVGALKVVSGVMTVGQVVAFLNYSRMFSEPVGQISSMAQMLQSGVASAERTFQLLDATEQEPDSANTVLGETATGHVAFKNVEFSYTPEKPLIEDLSLEVQPGQTVAIVGPTGAGKTTLVNLIMRFYELNSGSIQIDGVDIRELSRSELRRRVGMVLQDAFLFTGTIRENIRYGNLDASDEDVIAAAKATMVDHFVRLLPDGYDTVLEENGSTLSSGERQLLTIARAFVAQPSLLILDEATSSVDTRTEVLVQKAMNSLRAGRTSFVIAHRLSTIRDADLIIMMENGKVVEQGTHQELASRGGSYAKLLAAQFNTETTESEN
ncbi:MAG: ABC transporter ATP-binding protein [Arcanobacterium sp.]|nr:ABC transporter ATP-binding protein [Arcanobacterium sp.]